MQTSFHHQPEAQHPKSPAIETPAGRLPHLLGATEHAGLSRGRFDLTACLARSSSPLTTTRHMNDGRT
jgi:hypothetical protein